MNRHRLILSSIVLLSFLCAGTLFAEVSVILDGQGRYVKTLTLFKTKHHQTFYWEPVRKGIPGYQILNMAGDFNGDGRPRLAEHPFEKTPWVVWPYFDGNDFEIACSYWTGTGWSAPMIIGNLENEIDDVEPSISFEGSGIPFITFTRKAETSQIYVTAFLNGKWLKPILVSDPSIDCSKPTLIFQRDIVLVVFLTPNGIKFVPLHQMDFAEEGDEGSFDGIEEGPNPLPEATPSGGNDL
jgi:hypothetical protein